MADAVGKAFVGTAWLGALLGASTAALAQTAPAAAAAEPPAASSAEAQGATASSSNQDILAQWNQQTGSQGTLVQDVGGTRLVWNLNATGDRYRNEIESTPAGPLMSPLQSGEFFRYGLQGSLRWLRPDQSSTHVQGMFNSSNDRAVLSRYISQVANFQVGHTSRNWQANLGDVTVNFSPLGSMLGLRGVAGSLNLFGDSSAGAQSSMPMMMMGMPAQTGLSVAAHAGAVSDSWEALTNRTPQDGRPARTRYIRDVWGSKIEYRLQGGWRAFTTIQGFADREDSVQPLGSYFTSPQEGTSASVGIGFDQGRWQFVLEGAGSRYQELMQAQAPDQAQQQAQDERRGEAVVAQLAYRLDRGALRAGTNLVRPTWTSVSQTVPPGVREVYVGGDHLLTPTLNAGLDLRHARNESLQLNLIPRFGNFDPALFPPPPPLKTRTNTLAVRANWQLPAVQGLSLNLNQTVTRGKDPQQLDTGNDSSTLGLAYFGPRWNAGLTGQWMKNFAEASAFSTNRMRGVQMQGGINLARLPSMSMAPPMLQFTVTRQTQETPAAAQENTMTSYGLRLSGEFFARTRLMLAWQRDTIDSGSLKQHTTTGLVEASYLVLPALAIKAYARLADRNQGAPQSVEEQVNGIGLEGRF